MYAILCEESTEPLTKRTEHVSLDIIQKSDTWLTGWYAQFTTYNNQRCGGQVSGVQYT